MGLVLLQADLLTINKYTSQNGEGISAAWFADCQLFCQQIWRQKICWQEGFFLQADLLTVRKSASRFWVRKFSDRYGGYFCQHICWLSVNLPADLEENVRISSGRNGETGISASRFNDCQLICQQILRREEICQPKLGTSAGRFTDCQLFCQQIWTVRKSSGGNRGIFLQADLLSVS